MPRPSRAGLRVAGRSVDRLPSRDCARGGDDGASPRRHELEQLVDVIAERLDQLGFLEVGHTLDALTELAARVGEAAATVDESPLAELFERGADLVGRVTHLLGGGRARVRRR